MFVLTFFVSFMSQPAGVHAYQRTNFFLIYAQSLVLRGFPRNAHNLSKYTNFWNFGVLLVVLKP